MNYKRNEKNELLSQLRARISNLAIDVNERDKKLTPQKAMYLNQSMAYRNSGKYPAMGRGRIETARPYQMVGNYKSYPYMIPSRYPGDPSMAVPGSATWRRPRRKVWTGGWNNNPVPPKWKYRIPDNELKKMSNIPDEEWEICWNFNSAKGCHRGSRCSWRHNKYSAAFNHPITREPLQTTRPIRLTTAGRHTSQKTRQQDVPEAEKKHEDAKNSEAPEAEKKREDEELDALLSASSQVVEASNAETRDRDTDTKEVKLKTKNLGSKVTEPVSC